MTFRARREPSCNPPDSEQRLHEEALERQIRKSATQLRLICVAFGLVAVTMIFVGAFILAGLLVAAMYVAIVLYYRHYRALLVVDAEPGPEPRGNRSADTAED